MKLHYSKFTLILIFLLSSFLNATDFTCANPKPFEIVYNKKAYSKLLLIGNTSLCANNGSGVCEDPGSARNNDINMMHNDYDDTEGITDNSTTTSNSSAALLDIPTDKKILYAGLYWQGYMENWTDAQKELGHNVKYKHEDASSYEVKTNGAMNWVYFNSSRFYYQAYLDITDYVNQHKGGYYWVGDLASEDGKPAGGSFGAWSLVVVYEDNSENFNDITVYNGYEAFAGSGDIDDAVTYANNNSCDASNTGVGNQVSTTLDNFLTPKEPDEVISTLAVFAGEGDLGSTGDGGTITNNSTTAMALSNTANPVNDIMNASISNKGVDVTTGKPFYSTNNLGIDIDSFDVSHIIENSQSSTDIVFETSGDGYMPGMYAIQTQLYVPEFCYDYAYKQNETYFTEENDGSQDPKITGNVTANQPIEVTIFLKNLVDSEFEVKNMSVDVVDINTTQLTYTSDTIKRALSGELYPTSRTDTEWGLTTNSSDVLNIPIGDQVNNDYFYIYYSLDPKQTDLNDSININVDYQLDIGDGNPIDYNLVVGEKIPMCSTSNFNYTPAKGQFVVVHKPIYSASNKYNLPTQVTNREANLQVISIDEDFSDGVDTLTNVSTVVAVEMIDVASFHYTDASCREADSAITEKVWLLFDGNVSSVDFASGDTSLFYATAKQSAAFRVTYNAVDIDGNLIEVNTLGVDNYVLKNPPNYADNLCYSQFGDGTQLISDNCDNTGMTKTELDNCMECLYGRNTRFVCSRDNFAIRPEAFAVEFDDQEQATGASKLRILDDVSGVSTATAAKSHLASGYKYNLNIKAITHKDSNPSIGYKTTYSDINADTRMMYAWTPSVTTADCNDDANKFISPSISSFTIDDGEININTSLNQVGEYTLSMLDTTWTHVDSDPQYMTHHDEDDYLLSSSVKDCVDGSSATVAEGSISLNGCNISSEHTSIVTGIQYKNYNIEFHPYKFDMTGITASFGENNSTSWATKPFIYMSDISQNEEMSFHLNGQIKPTGYAGTEMFSNFIDSCYAKPLQLDLKQTGSSGNVAFQYRYNNLNDNSLMKTGDVNTTNPYVLLLGTDEFKQIQNGAINTALNLNFARDQKVAVNPETITYNNYKIKCQNTIDCNLQADLSPDGTLIETIEGELNLPFVIEHYYGRTNAPRQRYNGSDGNASIYFEVYCNECDKTKLQASSLFTNDPRWLTNNAHTTIDYGLVGNVTQKYTSKITATTPTTTAPSITSLSYTGSVYPYKATMQNQVAPWLIYNKYNASTDKNEFEVEFNKNTGVGWAGISDTNTSTVDTGSKKTNRRTMW